MNDPQNDTPRDPIAHAAELVSPNHSAALEARIKRDVFTSIGRIKPAVVADADFEKDVLAGEFFAGLSAPLQGIAIARTEGVLAFYNRVGWNPLYLTTPLSAVVPEEGLAPLSERYHASTLHDLAYVHPKHFEKMLGKTGAATLWESLKRFSAGASMDESTGAGEGADV